MAWPLTWIVILGTLPGVFIGCYVRILYLSDPRTFKLFVDLVLLYIGVKLLYERTARAQAGNIRMGELDGKFAEGSAEGRLSLPSAATYLPRPTGLWGSSSASAVSQACISAHVTRNMFFRSSSSSCWGS